jgi:hypothetical protein
MQRRGCFFLEEQAGEWRRNNWQGFYESHAGGAVQREAKAETRLRERWSAYLSQPGYRTEDQLARRLQELAPRFGFAEPPFQVYWLPASARRTGLSYRFRNDRTVRVHGSLAHPSVPKEVIDYELSYWLAAEKAGGRWESVEQAIRDAGLWTSASKAIRWRRNSWPNFRPQHLPLH